MLNVLRIDSLHLMIKVKNTCSMMLETSTGKCMLI